MVFPPTPSHLNHPLFRSILSGWPNIILADPILALSQLEEIEFNIVKVRSFFMDYLISLIIRLVAKWNNSLD